MSNDKTNLELINAEKLFDKLAKEARKIKVHDDDFEFLPYTEIELEEIRQANKIVDKIELIHLRLDKKGHKMYKNRMKIQQK